MDFFCQFDHTPLYWHQWLWHCPECQRVYEEYETQEFEMFVTLVARFWPKEA